MSIGPSAMTLYATSIPPAQRAYLMSPPLAIDRLRRRRLILLRTFLGDLSCDRTSIQLGFNISRGGMFLSNHIGLEVATISLFVGFRPCRWTAVKSSPGTSSRDCSARVAWARSTSLHTPVYLGTTPSRS